MNEHIKDFLIKWNLAKKEGGFIPTVDMLIEELIEEPDNNYSDATGANGDPEDRER